MDAGVLGSLRLDLSLVSSLASVVLVDLVLSGDNAVVIAAAVRSLPRDRRARGMLLGSGAAALLRVALTFLAARLLLVGGVGLAGGVFVAGVGVRLFMEGAPARVRERDGCSLGQAVRLVVFADLGAALDNVAACGGAANGSLLPLLGLALTVPFVVFTSSLLPELLDRHPLAVSAGAALLGTVAVRMALGDPLAVRLLQPSPGLRLAAEAGGAAGVVLAGRLRLRILAARGEPQAGTAAP
jgi:YjbE family integral membrane protein